MSVALAGPAEKRDSCRDEHDTDRHVDEEDEGPPQRVDQEAAQDGAEDAADGDGGPEEAHRAAAFLRWKGRVENRPGDAECHRPAHRLENPE